MSAEYQVPRLLWETFESVLLAQGRIFVKDVAKRLEVNEKELLRRVMPSSKIKVYLHDTSTDSLLCQAFVQTGIIMHHCRKPVSLGCEFCSLHRTTRYFTGHDVTEENYVQRIEDSPDRPALWKCKDGSVIDYDGNVRGYYEEEGDKLVLFEI